MGKVNILPPEVANKIAAGEVVERPASVVKELLENSIDAGAENIEIYIENSGKKLINIKDNGVGIEPDDIEKIFYRHATSKINSLEDLFHIHSLGFRGEALYSISAVSDLTLRTKTQSAECGWQIHIRGGKKLSLKPTSVNTGTEVMVRELFFNTPARRKFLKSDITELHQILNTVIPYTLIYHRKRFSLTHNQRILINLSPTESFLERISKALNISTKHFITTEKSFEEIKLKLILGNINIKRPRKDMQFIFVNNRPVYHSSISYHINQIYRLIFPRDVYPVFLIYIFIPSDRLDVNIHPTKREVKIKDEGKLLQILRSLCEKTILNEGEAKQIETIPSSLSEYIISPTSEEITKPAPPDGKNEKKYNFKQTQFNLIKESKRMYAPEKDKGETKEEAEEKDVIYEEPKTTLREKLATAKFIGTFLNKYLFFQTSSSLLIIDQHAAQERVTYEQILNQIEAQRLEVQNLLTPITLSLTKQEFIIWETIKEKLENLGFSTTLWAENTIALHSKPQLINDAEIALRNLLTFDETVKNFDLKTLARRACRNSLKAGYSMSEEQAEYLRNELIKCLDPFTCPHGRPTVTEIEEKIIAKQFLR